MDAAVADDDGPVLEERGEDEDAGAVPGLVQPVLEEGLLGAGAHRLLLVAPPGEQPLHRPEPPGEESEDAAPELEEEHVGDERVEDHELDDGGGERRPRSRRRIQRVSS